MDRTKRPIFFKLKNLFSKAKIETTQIELCKDLQESEITHESLQERQKQQEYGDEKIVLNQQLFKIQQQQMMQQSFHPFIGALTFTVQDKQGKHTGYGTATLISKNLILTAAHNIYSKGLGLHSNFRFYLAPFGMVDIDTFYIVQSWRYPKEYQSVSLLQKGKYDYAIMKLKQKITKKACPHCKISNIEKMELQIYGYPLHEQNYQIKDKKGKQFQLHQFGLSRQERVNSIDYISGKITYQISTLSGQSGCSVINQGKIIAVHTGKGKINQPFNVGRLLTIDVMLNLANWVKELKGSRFYINQDSVCLHYKEYTEMLEFIKYVKKDVLNIRFENQVIQSQILDISKQVIEEQLIIDCYQLPSIGILSSLNSVILMLFSAVSFKKSIIKLTSNPSLIFHRLIANVFSDITNNQSLQKKKKSLTSVAQHMQSKNSRLFMLVINDAVSCLLQVLNLLQEEDANNSKLNYFKINYEPRCYCKQGGMLQCYLVKSGQSCITCKSQIKYRILNSGPYLITMPSNNFKLQNYIKLVNKDNNEMFYQNKSFISHHKDYKGGYYMCHRITEQGWIQTKDQSAKLVGKIQNITVTPIITLYEFKKRKVLK